MVLLARFFLLLFIFWWSGLRHTTAQCLTDFTKLLPEPNYLAVGASGFGGKVYLFKKPAGGWEDHTELATFSVSDSRYLGIVGTHPIEISPDEQTIVITDPYRIEGVNPKYPRAIAWLSLQRHMERLRDCRC